MLPRAHRAASNIRRVEVGEVAWIATDLVPSVPTLGGVGGVGAPGHPGGERWRNGEGGKTTTMTAKKC